MNISLQKLKRLEHERVDEVEAHNFNALLLCPVCRRSGGEACVGKRPAEQLQRGAELRGAGRRAQLAVE